MTIEEVIDLALIEDLGDGDHTSLATIPKYAIGKAMLTAKENGILAGVKVATEVFKKIDPDIQIEFLKKDGDFIQSGDIVFTLEGKSQLLLSAERTALNFIQRMSGIATFTHQVVQKLEGLQTKVLDTRKTTACNRVIEKLAVKIGGGHNHRFGLYDMIMIKDNHVDFAGGIQQAISATKTYLNKKGKDLKIEIEVRDFAELDEVMLTGGVDRIMLDNFTPSDLEIAVRLIDGKYETEASGGISIDNIRKYAETGVDFISVGALTHQIKSLDLSLTAKLPV
ncbi:MAG: carboxylating nicotinate-nucleotide diphosphorylase [Bacteroidetes bacterium]|nr:MAG: carboxylating nicotinate-nucleotide diphosphorylase [Bacteroidota bacterium]